MELELSLTDLRPFKTVILAAFCNVGFGVCVINFSYSFQWMLLKLCSHIVDILEMCMWVFDGA